MYYDCIHSDLENDAKLSFSNVFISSIIAWYSYLEVQSKIKIDVASIYSSSPHLTRRGISPLPTRLFNLKKYFNCGWSVKYILWFAFKNRDE